MSNEDICCDYITLFNKDFVDRIPVSDLADLLLYITHLKKVKNIEVDGFDYLSDYQEEGIEEVDHYSVSNALMFIQQLKAQDMTF
jgi:hypothetical protein